MLIGLDASRADVLEKTGVEWYARHAIQALKNVAGQEAHSWLLYARKTLSPDLGMSPPNWHEQVLSWSFKRLWTQVRLSLEIHQHKPDVLFVPAHALPRVLPARSVVTVHDIGAFRVPQVYSATERWWQKRVAKDAVRRASRVLTVSEYSKQELIRYCQADPAQVSVIYPGVDHLAGAEISEADKRAVIDRYRISGSYFLYVGRLETKKNLLTLIEAFRRYKEDRGLGDPVSLVLAGAEAQGYSTIQRAIAHAAMDGFIIQTGYVSEEEKRVLMAGAIALVQPSWYEGFGFTPLEAMSLACPVVCSRAGSLPEVVGVENALWFDPADPEALAVCLDQIVRDEASRQALREQGRLWVTKYTWKRTAEELLRTLTVWP